MLLREEQTAAYSVEIWKRFRKWSGIPTGITQNVKDLLSSREVENIFENSDFVLMLNQAVSDRNILAKQLNISPQQMKYITHTEAGEGGKIEGLIAALDKDFVKRSYKEQNHNLNNDSKKSYFEIKFLNGSEEDDTTTIRVNVSKNDKNTLAWIKANLK